METEMTNLPRLGAAMSVAELEIHRDWIIDEQRDLELQDFTTADALNGDWSPIAERAKALLAGYSGRLGIHGPFWGFTLDSMDPDIRAVVRHRLDQALSVCETIGATQMVIHSPYTTWSYNNLDNVEGSRDGVVERFHDTLHQAVKRAEDIGVTMVIENIEDIDADIRCTLADTFNSKAVAVSIDTGHAHYAHGSNGAHPVDYYVKRAGNRLQHIHLQDADGHADRHWQIGHGTVNWFAVFEALGKLESKPRLIMELRNKDGLLPSAAWLKSRGLAQ